METLVQASGSTSLQNTMIEKSQESFLLAIELYNKPTINLRIEGFCFFICNAWDLLLKAKRLSNNESIYYEKTGSNQNKTYALTELIKKIMTNENDPVRINLGIIINIRNMAAHLIIPEYAHELNDIFLACTKNYTLKLFQYFGISISEKLKSDFLTMHIPSNNSKVELIDRYDKEIIENYNEVKSNIRSILINNAKDDGSIPDSIAIGYEINFKKVNKKEEADLLIAKHHSADHYIIKEKEYVHPATTHPYSYNKVIEKINEELSQKNITFTPLLSNKKCFNKYLLNLFIKYYNIKENKEFSYAHKIGNNTDYTYSIKLIDFLINAIIINPDIFLNIKEGIKHKKS